MKKNFLFFIILAVFLSIHAESTKQINGVLNPASFRVAGQEIFIAEGFEVKVFDLNTLKLKFKFGRKGEGPGEFKFSPVLSLTDKNIIVNAGSGKTMLFSKKGKLLKEVKVPSQYPLFLDSGSFILKKPHFDVKNFKTDLEFQIFNSAGKTVKSFYRSEKDMNFDMGFLKGTEEWKMICHFYNALYDRGDNQIYVADSRKGLYFKVFDIKGKFLYEIKTVRKRVKVADKYKTEALKKLKEKKTALKAWKRLKNRNFTFYEYFPQIKSALIRKGIIFVQTHLAKDGKAEFLKLDKRGSVLGEYMLPLHSFYDFYNNTYFFLVHDEENDIWNLKSIKLRN